MIQTGNQAIVQVKGNQPLLLKSCAQTAEREQSVDTSTSRTKGHGRRETRTAQVFTTFASFSASVRKRWGTYIKAVIKETRVRREFSTRDKRWKRTTEETYYVATATFSAQRANQLIRAHWSIENKNHYVRDVTMREDASRIRKNPDRFVRLRSFALNILRANGEKNIGHALFTNSLSFENVLNYRGIS